MGFDFPDALIFFAVLPVALWLLWRGLNYTHYVASLFRTAGPSRTYIIAKIACVVVLASSLVIAGAKPYIEPRSTADYIFLTDISRSMMARNYCSEPTFLDRSKAIMHSILNEIPEGRFGMMVFARLAFPVTQMTFDHDYLHNVIDNGLQVGMIFEATATSIPNALSEVANKKITYPDIYGHVEYVVLFSDGHVEGDWRNELTQSIGELQQAGIKVLAVGIGNPGETPMPRVIGGECMDDYIMVNGRTLRIALQDDLLKFIATETGGEYFGEGTIDDLIEFMRDQTLKTAEENTAFTRDQRRDISGIFLLSASIALFGFLLL